MLTEAAASITQSNHPLKTRNMPESKRGDARKGELAITVRHRVLAEVIKRVSSPLKRSELLVVAQYVIRGFPFTHQARMAKRHKLDGGDGVVSAKEGLLKQVARQNESALSELLLEIAFLSRLTTARRKTPTTRYWVL